MLHKKKKFKLQYFFIIVNFTNFIYSYLNSSLIHFFYLFTNNLPHYPLVKNLGKAIDATRSYKISNLINMKHHLN